MASDGTSRSCCALALSGTGPLSLAALREVGTLVDATVKQLDQMANTSSAVIHGDLIPANIHVDDEMRPMAALDFGFLTAVGDPAFDAAVAASVFDMYGVNARAAEAVIDEATTARFGYDPRHLMVYRAAYALVTSNCFSPSAVTGTSTGACGCSSAGASSKL